MRLRRAAIIAILSIFLATGTALLAGQYDSLKLAFNERNWNVKYNQLVDAASSLYANVSTLATLINNWAIEDNIVTMVTATPTYVDGDTFTLPGDYTSRLTAGKVIQAQVAAGMVYSTVASSSYASPTTTVNLNDSVLTNPITRVYVVATRDGLWPNGPGYVVAADYGSNRAALEAADAVAAAAGKLLLISIPYTIDANVTLLSKPKWMPGAIATIATDKTLTIANGSLEAGPYQIFSCVGTGSVVGITKGYFEWFGAVGDGVTDDTAAFNLLRLSNIHIQTVPGKTYKLTAAITYSGLTNLTIELVAGAIIKQSAADTAALIFNGCNNVRITGEGTISGPGNVAGLPNGLNVGVQVRASDDFHIDGPIRLTGFQSFGLGIGWNGANSITDLCRNPLVDGVIAFGNRGGGIHCDLGYNAKITNCAIYGNGGFTSPAGTIAHDRIGAPTTITGTGTSFLSDFVVGDRIRIDGIDMIRRITAVNSDNDLTIAFPFTVSFSGEAYSKVTDASGGAGIVAGMGASANLIIENNHIYGNSRKGIDSHISQRLSIQGNQVHDNSTHGIELACNDDATLPPMMAQVKNNTVYHQGDTGITTGSGTTSRYLRIQINENTLWQNNSDIYVTRGKHLDISHNICIDSTSFSIVCAADVGASNITMIGNMVLDMGSYGIQIGAAVDNLRMIGNSVMWTSDSSHPQAGTGGYNIAGGTNLVWDKNTASGCNVNFAIPTNLGDAYDLTVGLQRIHNNIDKIFSPVQTVADNTVIDLPNARGMLFVFCNSYPAIYGIGLNLNTTYEMSDPANKFSVTKDNAGTINIYYDTGYKLQNKTGGSATIGMTMIHTDGYGG